MEPRQEDAAESHEGDEGPEAAAGKQADGGEGEADDDGRGADEQREAFAPAPRHHDDRADQHARPGDRLGNGHHAPIGSEVLLRHQRVDDSERLEHHHAGGEGDDEVDEANVDTQRAPALADLPHNGWGHLGLDGGNPRKHQAGDRQESSHELQTQGVGKPKGGVQGDADRGGTDVGDGPHGLVEGVDAHEVLLGDQHRHGRTHRRKVEGLEAAAQSSKEAYEGEAPVSQPGQRPERQRHTTRPQVRDNHDGAAVIAVSGDPAERCQKAEGQLREGHDDGELEGRSFGRGDVPDDRPSRRAAGDDGKRLAAPDHRDHSPPVRRQGTSGGANERG